jgi:dihydrofolate synthase/folylpolyglutamate synthase
MVGDSKLVAAMARLDALTDWERRPRSRMRVGLEPALDLAARLGHPEASFRAVHVAGTKGKGSVSALIEAALQAAGFRVGRYASPHVERVNERVSLNSLDVDDVTLASGLEAALDAFEAARREGTAAHDATWFDLLTLAAFTIFRAAKVEWAVVEVGLGGRLDSTNIVDGEVAVVTNIALEHTEILGSTRAAIAAEKAGVIKPGAIVVTTLAPDDEAGRVVHARAAALGCEVVRSDAGRLATIDATNVALAGAALDALGAKGVTTPGGVPVSAALLDAGARARARLVGRMERFAFGARGLTVILDGAHVPFNIAAVLSDLARDPALAGPCVALVALARDKDAGGFLIEVGRRASRIVLTDVPHATRGRPAAELQAIAASLGYAAEAEPDARRAFRRAAALAEAAGQWLIVTGSLYLVGALRGEAITR